MLVLLGFAGWKLYRQNINLAQLDPLEEVSPQEKRLVQELTNPPVDSESEKIAFDYFKNLFKQNSQVSGEYLSVRKKFPTSDSGFAAARFVAAYPVLGGGFGYSEFGQWNQKQINQNPDDILHHLKNQDWYLKKNVSHQAILNLVHALRLPASVKMQIYSKSILQSLKFSDGGDVIGGADNFEMSLMMAKDDGVSGLALEPVLKQLVKDHPQDKSKALVKDRVRALYPELQSIF